MKLFEKLCQKVAEFSRLTFASTFLSRIRILRVTRKSICKRFTKRWNRVSIRRTTFVSLRLCLPPPYNVESPIKICFVVQRDPMTLPSTRLASFVVFPGTRYFPSARLRFFPSTEIFTSVPKRISSDRTLDRDDEFFGKESRRNKAWRISSRHACLVIILSTRN